MGKRSYHSLKREDGQALVELPYVIVLSCVLILLTLQPAVFLYTQMALGQIASGIGRIVATEDANPTGSKEILIRAYASDKLEGLPRGKAFRIPGTLRIDVAGDARSDQIEVVVSVKQEPLPLIGLLLGAGISQDVEVSGRAVTRGAQIGVQGTPKNAPQHYGHVQP
ncbi:MAG: hypothetical protein FWE48_00420 [Coriobacteriia bacterium]|nr:hypothetical protein [Coriobacteriia bacterium]MCL2745551.1 hypothetical protein [Coriobacteriia bacterium]MCL2870433.1 hypothetical protein [Coriobacteriia bacterium]